METDSNLSESNWRCFGACTPGVSFLDIALSLRPALFLCFLPTPGGHFLFMGGNWVPGEHQHNLNRVWWPGATGFCPSVNIRNLHSQPDPVSC